MADANKIGDLKLAQRVIEAYASGLDALTAKECAGLKIDAPHCSALQNALGKGAEGVVTDGERKDLAAAGFSDEFIKELAGVDGKRALIERVKWLGDHVVKRWWRRDASLSDRTDMFFELSCIGPTAVHALIGLLKDEDKEVRQWAVLMLADIGPPAAPAVGVLIEALRDKSDSVRSKAAHALGMVGPAAAPAVPALIESLNDTAVRFNAVDALGKIGLAAAAAVPALIGILGDEDTYVDLRRIIATALGQIGERAHDALPFLEGMRDNQNEDPDCRWAAGEAVEKILEKVK